MIVKTAEQILSEFSQQELQHQAAKNLWRVTHDYTVVQRSGYYNNLNVRDGSKISEMWNNLYYVYDETGVMQTLKLASSLSTFLVNSKGKWFTLIPYNKSQRKDVAFRKALDEISKKALEELDNTRFYSHITECLLDFASIGNAAYYIGEGKGDEVITFNSLDCYNMWWIEDAEGAVTSYWRKNVLSAYQLINLYMPEDKEVNEMTVTDIFGKSVWESYMRGDANLNFSVIHHVYPISPQALRKPSGDKFHSVHVINMEGPKILKKATVPICPYGVLRGPKVPQTPYGVGQGTIAIPRIKSQQVVARSVLLSAQKAVDPAMVGPANMRKWGVINSNPGHVNRVNMSKGEDVRVLGDFKYDIIYQFFEVQRQMIKDIFFDMELNVTRGQYETAKAVAENSLASLRVLQPIVGGLEKEALKPIVEYTVEQLYKRRKEFDLVDEFKLLQGTNYKIRLTSEIAISNRIKNVENFIRGLDVLGVLEQRDESVKDRVNYDSTVMALWDMLNLPFENLRDDEAFMEIQQEKQAALEEQLNALRSQQNNQQQLQQMQAVQQGAQGIKEVSQAQQAQQPPAVEGEPGPPQQPPEGGL